MHPILHSFKRTYWSSMRSQRFWMHDWREEWGVTPARFDMLLVIDKHGGPVRQTEIKQTLDVCWSVVDVMLEALEAWELVERMRDPADRRHKLVWLTDHGKWILEGILREMLHEGFTERAVRRILARGKSRNPDDEREGRILERMRRYLRYLRTRVRDRSTHVYPAYTRNGRRDPGVPFRPPQYDRRPRGPDWAPPA